VTLGQLLGPLSWPFRSFPLGLVCVDEGLSMITRLYLKGTLPRVQ
jgi:hypothetical protein